MSARCEVCGKTVRVSKGRLIKHRVDFHVCPNSGSELRREASA